MSQSNAPDQRRICGQSLCRRLGRRPWHRPDLPLLGRMLTELLTRASANRRNKTVRPGIARRQAPAQAHHRGLAVTRREAPGEVEGLVPARPREPFGSCQRCSGRRETRLTLQGGRELSPPGVRIVVLDGRATRVPSGVASQRPPGRPRRCRSHSASCHRPGAAQPQRWWRPGPPDCRPGRCHAATSCWTDRPPRPQ
jgi:hypothetical protein